MTTPATDRPIRVLVVDDDPDWSLVLDASLRDLGCEVRAHGRARDVATDDLDWCDLAAIDWYLVETLGDLLTGVLGVRRPDLPTAVVTAEPSGVTGRTDLPVLDKAAGPDVVARALVAILVAADARPAAGDGTDPRPGR